jgi:hypothetical protein
MRNTCNTKNTYENILTGINKEESKLLMIVFLIQLLHYPAAESPQFPPGVECFLPIAGCRVLERSLRLLPEGLHWKFVQQIDLH